MDVLTPEQYVLEMVRSNNPNALVDYDTTTIIDPADTDRYNSNTIAKMVPVEPYLKGHYKEIWYNRLELDDVIQVTQPDNMNSYGVLDEVSEILKIKLSEKDVIKDIYLPGEKEGKLRMSKLNVAFTGEIKLIFGTSHKEDVDNYELNGYETDPYKLESHKDDISNKRLGGFVTDVYNTDTHKDYLDGSNLDGFDSEEYKLDSHKDELDSSDLNGFVDEPYVIDSHKDDLETKHLDGFDDSGYPIDSHLEDIDNHKLNGFKTPNIPIDSHVDDVDVNRLTGYGFSHDDDIDKNRLD